MYLGLFGILLGLAIMVGTLPFYAAAIAYLVVMNEVFCPDEEQRLELLFVGDFRAYSARVRRWL